MPKITKPLTNTEVKQAKPKDKEFNLSDGDGLSLKVKPSGSKLWFFNYYRPHSKKRANMSFGSFPEVSLAQARAKRLDARALLANDIDPQEHRNEQKRINGIAHANTLEHITLKWLEVKKGAISSAHAEDTWRSLELHIFPNLGKTPIHKISAIKTIEAIQPIAAKGSLETVKRLCQRLNEVMIYAVNSGIIKSNPLAGISKAFQNPVKKHLPTLKPDDLPLFMATLSKASIKLTTRCLIEWQLHTMVRPSEAAGSRWEEIDLNNQLWSIPAKRMKSKKPHTVPLTPQALSLLDIMKTISSNSEYIFPSDRDPRKPTNSQTANTAIKRMGFDKQLVAHGLRSIASTTLNEEGFDPDVIEAALAHTGKNEVRNAYNRTDYLNRRKPIMAWWSQYIDKAAFGNMALTGKNGLKVVSR
ncbi:integrase domain-containing protein [Cycloclasticus pugetii]|uniref:integrase domain-containing protein n=1 Tax=Cycloclasticus pugetii TaxID=34068 RepID=UPI00037DD9B3|nr:integrase domain-containing protein [Cycloclasticus pugetii]